MTIEVHVDVYTHGGTEHRELLGLLHQLLAQGATIMATVDELRAQVTAGFSALNDATNAMAARLIALVNELKGSGSQGLGPDDVTNIVGKLQAEATLLQGFAVDPNNPAPGVIPPVTVTPVLQVPDIDPATGNVVLNADGKPLDVNGAIITVDAAGFQVDTAGTRVPGATAIPGAATDGSQQPVLARRK